MTPRTSRLPHGTPPIAPAGTACARATVPDSMESCEPHSRRGGPSPATRVSFPGIMRARPRAFRLVHSLLPRPRCPPDNAASIAGNRVPAGVLFDRGQSTPAITRDGDTILRLLPEPERIGRIGSGPAPLPRNGPESNPASFSRQNDSRNNRSRGGMRGRRWHVLFQS